MVNQKAQESNWVHEFGESFHNKRVLVTGASGFIGFHLCKAILDLRANVSGIAIEVPAPPELSGISFSQVDLRNYNSLKSYIKKTKPDFVFHLAGLVNTNQDMELVLPTLQHNLISTVNLLLVLEKSNVQKTVIISSSETPQGIETPNSPYAASKLSVTAYSKMFADLYGAPISIIRLFTCFGPFQSKAKLIPYVITSVLENIQPDISNPKKILDLIYVKDFVRGMLLTAMNESTTGKTLDFGSGYGLEIHQVVELITRLIKKKDLRKMTLIDEAKGYSTQVAELGLTAQLTGWSPAWTLEQGLTETIDWYKKNQR